MTAAFDVASVPRGEGRTVEVGGRRVALFHTLDGTWHALDAACPHRGGPLADGLLGTADGTVTCPLHNRRYELATGAPFQHDCPAVTAHDTEVRDGLVHVRLAAVDEALAA